MSDVDKDFQAVVVKINAKVKEAAAALREANKLTDEAGLPGLIYSMCTRDNDHSKTEMFEEMEEDPNWDGDERSPMEKKLNMIDVESLENEIDSAGWATSSTYC